jgi:outer membrane protein TolC
VRYENGASDFLQVLTAERTLLESEDRLARSRAEAATTLIAVSNSLGGGWENAPQPAYTAQTR